MIWHNKGGAILLVSIALIAAITIGAKNAGTPKQNVTEPTESVSVPATVPTSAVTQEPTQTPTETTQPTEPPTETEPPVILYAVPLSEDLQLHIIAQAENYGIDPAIVVAVIWKESRYNTWAGGDGGESLGLMQVQPKWHQWRMDALDCPDLFNPFQNVTVGCHILAEKFQKYGNIEMALMAYNAGDSGANRNWFSKGIYTNQYSKAVLEKAEELRGESYAFFR